MKIQNDKLNIIVPIAKIDESFNHEFGNFKYLSKLGDNETLLSSGNFTLDGAQTTSTDPRSATNLNSLVTIASSNNLWCHVQFLKHPVD